MESIGIRWFGWGRGRGEITFGNEVPVEVVVAGEADGDTGRYAEQ